MRDLHQPMWATDRPSWQRMAKGLNIREQWPMWLTALALLGQMTAQLVAGDHGDLPVFLGAAERLQAGASPYLTWIPTRNGHALQFVYPPLAAWLFAPFTWCSTGGAFFLWSLLRIVLAVRTLFLLFALAPTGLSERRRAFFQAVIVAVFLRFALDDLALGQWTIVLLFLSVEGLRRLQQGRDRSGAFLIALGTSLKLLPLLLLFGMALTKRWRALAWTIAFGLLLTALPMSSSGLRTFSISCTSGASRWTPRTTPTSPIRAVTTPVCKGSRACSPNSSPRSCSTDFACSCWSAHG